MEQRKFDSSLEELTPEERLMLVSSKRQEPQGQEHTSDTGIPCGGLSRSTKKLRVAPSKPKGQMTSQTQTKGSSEEYNTSSCSSSTSSLCSEGDEGNTEDNKPKLRQKLQKKTLSSQAYHPRGNKSTNTNISSDSNSHSAYNTLIIHQNNSSLLADTWIPASHEFTSVGMGNNPGPSSGGNSQQQQQSRKSASPSQSHDPNSGRKTGQQYSNPYENVEVGESGMTSSELSDIPRDYLNQLTVLKHLAKEVQQDPVGGSSGSNLLRSASFSKSQPDLTQSGHLSPRMLSHDVNTRPQPQQPPTRRKKQGTPSGENSKKGSSPGHSHSHTDEVIPSVQILEILMRENATLNAELVNARRKIETIHKVEAELARLQSSHSALFESAERRESLERSARAKLSSELKRLTAVNRELISSSASGSLQNLSHSPYSSVSGDIELYKKEIAKRDMMIAQLVSQNKELSATKERQDIELSAQRATLAEQRTHIDILDTALTNAQANVLRLEEECRKKQDFVDKSSQLQRALSSLQLSNDKREQCEKKARTQLEGEVTDLKLRLASMNANNGNPNANPPNPAQQHGRPSLGQQQSNTRAYTAPQPSSQPPPYIPPNSKFEINANERQQELASLQEKLRASEEQIHHLNSQVSKWDQVLSPDVLGGPMYSSNSSAGTGKQSQPASTPNTPNSWTHSNSRGGTPHFFGNSNDKLSATEEFSQSQTRASDMEWKIKDLESRLLERDAIIRVLQTVPNTYANSTSGSIPAMSPPLPNYRESPSYSQASTGVAGYSSPVLAGSSQQLQNSGLIYSKGLNLKGDGEPPSYANIPAKLRLGGSGSSLVKNSNESLQSTGGGNSSTGGNSPSISGPGSVSCASGTSGNNGAKSIDDQLKELNSQLLSKGGPGTLKMQSGLCCIPGFSNPTDAKRKGKIPHALLESLSGAHAANAYNLASRALNKPTSPTSVLPPKPPPSTYQTQHHGSQGQIRTSSGPPFISPSVPSDFSMMSQGITTTMSLSNSVDSVLSDANLSPSGNNNAVAPGGGNVFTPAVIGLPQGLPPRGPTSSVESSSLSNSASGKSRSLERNKTSSNPGEPLSGKCTVIMYDGARCRSLDRREVKTSKVSSGDEKEKKPEKESKGNLKSSVSSKAAFFGQLLTRRSPSPGREKKEKDKDKESTPKLGRRFPFGGKSTPQPAPQPPPSEASNKSSSSSGGSEGEVEAMLLDKQGRSSQSQRSRISSKWSSSNTLEAVEEQSGSESPWVQRKNKGGSGSESPKAQKQAKKAAEESGESSNKKWGRVIKTPFGLRYTFGSPRVAALALDLESASAERKMSG